MRRAHLSALAILSLIAAVLAACGGGGAPSAATNDSLTAAKSDLPTLPGNTAFHLDAINGMVVADPSTQPITLRRGTPLDLSGWATDAGAKAPAGGVRITFDDGVGGWTNWADYGIRRPDVAQASGLTTDAVGWQLSLPTDGLAQGAYILTFAVLSADGKGYYLPPLQVTVQIGA